MTKCDFKFQSFLEERILKTPLLQFTRLTRGGTSQNFLAHTADCTVVIKLFPNSQIKRAQRLCRILQTVSTIPDFSTPGLISFNAQPYFEYDGYVGLAMPFMPGRKLKNSEITPAYARKVIVQYNKFLTFDFAETDFINDFISTEEIYRENQEKINNLQQKNSSFLKRKTLNFLQENNAQIYKDIPFLEKTLTVIHGDASLNNMLLCPNDNIAFLDFEFIRYGYAIEDVVSLIFSILTPRLFFSRRLLKMMVLEANNAYHFTFEEWKFAINRYFLTLLQRRLRGHKLLKSARKDWLFNRIMRRRHIALDEISRLF